jgi:FG-GAP repeat
MKNVSTSLVSRAGMATLPAAIALTAVTLSAPAVAAQQVFETAKLVVPVEEVNAWDWLGHAVSATEDTAWVGEYGDDIITGNEGSVSGFVRTVKGWGRTRVLTAAMPVQSAQFGNGLSFDDGLGFVGSPWDSEVEARSGTIHLIEPSAGGWNEVTKIKAPDPDRFDLFGEHIVLSGDQVIVSARGDDEGGSGNGAAYVYRRAASGNWSLEQKLIPSYAGSFGGASVSLGLDGNVAVLGAGSWAGLAFVFERTASGWIQTAVLIDPNPSQFDDFGWGVAVEGDVIAIGEPVRDGSDALRWGSVFVYERTGPAPGNWTLAQKLNASNKSLHSGGGDQFGYDVDLHEGRLLVGAPYAKVGSDLRGTAYIFDRTANGWEETTMLAPSDMPFHVDHQHSPQFGRSVSLRASFALIGARLAVGSRPNVQSGAAYVFELPLGEPTCAGVPNSTGLPGTIRATGSLAASAGALDLWAEDLPPNQFGLFLIASEGGFVQTPPGSQGDLCLGGTVSRFPTSLQSSGPAGELHHVVDFDNLPLPPPAEILPGETWHCQAWYRDLNPAPTSNFTGALGITFR